MAACNTIGGMSAAYIGSASASAMYIGSQLAWSAMSTQYTSLRYVWSSGQPATVVTDICPEMDFTARVGIRLEAESAYTDTEKQGYIYYNSGNGFTSLAISGRTKSGVYTPMIEYYGGNREDGTVRRWRADNANNVPWGDYCKYDYNKEGIWETTTGEGANTGSPYVTAISNAPIVIDFSTVPIKFIKFWKNGRLVADLGALKRNSDDAVGLYDLVSGRFYEMPQTSTPQ